MKKTIIILICLIVVIAIGGYLYHIDHKKKPLTTISVKYGNITQLATAVGNIVPQHSSIVKSQISGVIDKLFVQSGDRVTRGEKLVLVKPNPDPTALAKAIALVQTNSDQLRSDNQSVASYRFMLNKHVISSNYTAYLAALRARNVDRNALLAAQQQLSLLQSGNATIGGHLVQNVVSSPIDGFVLQKMVDIGDSIISTGSYTDATALFSLADMNDLQFNGSIDETDADKIKSQMKATITLAAFPNDTFTGTVKHIALQSDSQNQSTSSIIGAAANSGGSSPFTNGFQIIINQLHLPKDITLRSGFSANASIVIKHLKHVLLIPERLLVFKGKSTFVKVMDNKKVKKQLIKTGIADGINIQILSGLTKGQQVVDNEISSSNS